MQKPRQPRGICHGFCWGWEIRLNRLLRPAGRALARATRTRAAHRRGRAQSVRGLLTAGRFACPAGYSGLSGAIAPGADKPRQAPLFAPHGTGAGRFYPMGQPRGRRGLYKRSSKPTVHGTACISAAPAPLFAAQPVSAQRPPHCSRRSRLKFFAEAFFQKGRERFTNPQARASSDSGARRAANFMIFIGLPGMISRLRRNI